MTSQYFFLVFLVFTAFWWPSDIEWTLLCAPTSTPSTTATKTAPTPVTILITTTKISATITAY